MKDTMKMLSADNLVIGCEIERTHRRDAESAEGAQRKRFDSLRISATLLCASAVNRRLPDTQVRLVTLLVALLLGITTASAQTTDTLIRNATILTASRGTLRNSDILIRDGKIAQVGANLNAPAGARVIDATGKYVMPGIVDAHSHAMMDAVNEFSLSVTSMTRIGDVLDPTDVDLYRHLAGGVTTLNLLHGSANAIGGQSSTVKIKYGRPLAEFIFLGAPPGIKFALGENPKRSNFNPPGNRPRRYPATRMGVAETIREAFTRAQDYKRTWDEYRQAIARGGDARRTAIQPRRDLQLEPLVEILEGRRLVHAHCYRADEIVMILNLADEFGFKIKTLQHVLEGYKVAPEIARHGAGASIFIDNWGYKMEAYDSIPYAAAIMTRAGIVVSINSDSNERARRLNIEAAKAMKYGDLTEEEALRLITLNPARQLGVESRVGSIDVGKDADLAIWTEHPFSTFARVETTFVDGQVFFDRAQDLARRATLDAERRELEAAEPNRPPGAGGAPPAVPRPRRPAYGHLDNCMEDHDHSTDGEGN